jgi:succinate dehydrogenase / fumarate reductase flavoprotein subunit
MSDSSMELNGKCPTGPIETRWERHRFNLKLVNPANKRKYTIIMVGTGLAGGSAAASLAELGYRVKAFCFQDSPRRAHSIAAQGGINAAKNYHNDGDSIYRLFYDTVKGGDFRARESNVYRLAQVSVNIIDQCVAQGVPFAREYSGYLDNRSFGGAQVSRTFYARGQTGQQLLLGAYQALERQIGAGTVEMHSRSEMLDLIVIDGRARGIVTRDLITGKIESHIGDAVVLGTGGYGNVFYLSTNAKGCNTTAIWRAHKKGALFANPCFTQIHPTCIPVSGEYQSKLTLMSESLRNDGRVWVPLKKGDKREPSQIPENERDYFLERKYPSFGNLVPRDVASRNAKMVCDEGRGVGETGLAVYLDFRDAIQRLGAGTIKERYGNLFDMYQRITGEDPYKNPMRIYPAIHYTMGGLWVDYNLMSTIPGLYVIGEANFSDHGANRLGASALMQGLGDGYFVLPNTIGDYLASSKLEKVDTSHAAVKEAEAGVAAITKRLLDAKGKRSVDSFHRELGKLLWEYCGMARNAEGLKKALATIPGLREQYWRDVKVLGTGEELNQSLEKAGRVADFFELAELMCLDALERNESCGGHFREEYQTPEGEAARDDEHYAYAAAWEFKGVGNAPALHKEPLTFEYVHPSQRSYK